MESTIFAVAALAALGAILFTLERLVPLRPSRTTLFGRLLVNVAISVLAFAAAAAAVNPAASASLRWTSDASIGLLQHLDTPSIVRGVAAFLLLDLFFYYWHQLNHRLPLLWRFHNVHHIDPDLDVSTAFRFHFGEVLLSSIFRFVQIVVVGPSLAAYIAYEIAFQANTLFHHSNVRLPIRVERILNRILVTPRMHGIHHSQVRQENRSNYGVVFPWWDALHRTLRLNVPQSWVRIGIAGYSLPADNRLRRALAMPFCRQRDYWMSPDGRPAEREPVPLDNSPVRMAE